MSNMPHLPVVKDRRATWKEKALSNWGFVSTLPSVFESPMTYALSMMIALEDTRTNHDTPRHTDHRSVVLQEVLLPTLRVSISQKEIE